MTHGRSTSCTPCLTVRLFEAVEVVSQMRKREGHSDGIHDGVRGEEQPLVAGGEV